MLMSINRRTFLNAATGLGPVALSMMLGDARAAAPPVKKAGLPGLQGLPHFRPKVKRVIFLYMSGGPSHLETFDYKPKLAQMEGKPMPESFTKGQPIAQLQGAKLTCLGPRFAFR